VSDDPLDDDWSEDIKKTLHAHKLWKEAPYDGVMGELPKRIPGNFQLEFQVIRNRLLETYTHEELLDYISDAQRVFDPDEDYVRFWIPLKIIKDVTMLMYFQEADRLYREVGEEAGLAFLTDSDLAKQVTKGVKQYQNLAKGNLAASKNKTERANKYHDLWKKWARETWNKNPHWEVTRVADHVLKTANDKSHKMANGNAYKVGTIIKVITGVKKSSKDKN